MDVEQKFNWKIQKLERLCAEERSTAANRIRLAEAYFQKGYYLGKGDPWFDLALDQVSGLVIEGEANTVARALTLRGNALCGKADWEGAEVAYRRALEIEPTRALALVGLGNLEKRRRDYAKARAFFARATEIEPSLWQAHYNLGRAAHEEAQAKGLKDAAALLDTAIYHLIQALRQEPIETFVANIHRELGELFLYTRRYEDAKKFFTRLTRVERYAPLAHFYLGLTNYSLGKYKSSIQCYRTYLKHEPESTMAHAKIALAHLELGEGRRARRAAETAIGLDEENVLAIFTVGCTWLDEGHHDTAESYFERALTIDPEYFPAFSELARSHFDTRDHIWLFERLDQEVQAFDANTAYEGGRKCYEGPRGPTRRRIEILLSQVLAMGPAAFAPLMTIMSRCSTDSLKFQIWEDLYEMSLQLQVADAIGRLQSNQPDFSEELGLKVLELSRYLPTELLLEAARTNPDQIRRLALERLERRDDINEYKKAIYNAEAEYRSFKGLILRALAVKGTKEAETYLSEALTSEEDELRLSAAVALVYYGHEGALKVLESEASKLTGPPQQALKALIHTGWEKHSVRHKVIHLTDLYGDDRSTPSLSLAPSTPNRTLKTAKPRAKGNQCAVCHKPQREVERMLAGSELMICTGCVGTIWKQRGQLRINHADAYCSFCKRSLLEVDALYEQQTEPAAIHMCSGCLDLSTGVIHREEVERFLRDFH